MSDVAIMMLFDFDECIFVKLCRFIFIRRGRAAGDLKHFNIYLGKESDDLVFVDEMCGFQCVERRQEEERRLSLNQA